MVKCSPIALILLVLCVPPLAGSVDDPEDLFRAGRRAEAAGDTLAAFLLYARAAALKPASDFYAQQRMLLQARVAQSAITTIREPADAAERMAFRIATEELSPTDAIEGQRAVQPPRLRDPATRRDFDLRGTGRSLWEAVGQAFGVTMLFPADYQSAAATTFRVGQVTLEEALRILETVTSSFVVPIRADQAMVFNDTQQNRTDYVPNVSVSIPIPERFSIQEAQELASGLQQTMELRHIAVDAGRRVIFIRDQEAKVMGARKIVADLARLRAQVSIEVEFLSVARNSALVYGMSLPTTTPVVNFGDFLNNMITSVPGYNNFATFGGGATLLGMGITDASAFATLSRASADSLIRTQMTVLDGQQATLHIGDRYPIVTGRFGDPAGGQEATPITQYAEIGLILQLTPVVHSGGEMTLDLEAEYSVLGATQNNGIPIISSRKFQGVSRLKFGEWGVIAGLVTTVASDDVTGIPGLAQIPWLGRLFRRNGVVRDSGQVLVVIKPHLTALPHWEEPSRPLYIGTETKLVSVF
jgi:general secretion pathway protein D